MSVSISVVAHKDKDSKTFKQMLAAYKACHAAGVQPPDAVKEYFGWCEPDDNGVRVQPPEDIVQEISCGREYVIYLDKVPKDWDTIIIRLDS